MAVICTLSACGGKKERKARAALPPSGKYAEALLTSTWFSGPALIGPVGGPTQGYELTLEVWPEGPTLALAGEIGKDELDGDPMFRALRRPSPS